MECIDRHTLKDKVASRIREEILSGKLEPGLPLVESSLASELGVSRTVIRDALATLTAESIVVSSPYKGSSVAEFFPDDLRDIYRLRSLLEGYAIEQLANQRPQRGIKELEAIAERMVRPASKNQRRELAQLDFRFHHRLVALAGNKRLLASWNAVATQFLRSMAILSFYYEDIESIPVHHKRLVELIRAGECEKARQFMHETVEENGEIIAKLLESRLRARKHGRSNAMRAERRRRDPEPSAREMTVT
jgi:DNA-binding GntR family transcriptional regulator